MTIFNRTASLEFLKDQTQHLINLGIILGEKKPVILKSLLEVPNTQK